jgi:hypothetical protein
LSIRMDGIGNHLSREAAVVSSQGREPSLLHTSLLFKNS